MLTLIKALLSIASSLAQYAQQRQLLEAGRAQAILGGIREAEDAIDRARAARAGVRHDDDSVQSDPDNRDARD